MKDTIGSLSNDDIREIHEDYKEHLSDGDVRENIGQCSATGYNDIFFSYQSASLLFA